MSNREERGNRYYNDSSFDSSSSRGGSDSRDDGGSSASDATAVDTSLAVSTDKPDYTPGSTAVFTASNVTAGGSVEFDVAHLGAGADEVYGTSDDVLSYDISGTGQSWIVTDGGVGDWDGIVNGTVVTTWEVNQDALHQTFLLNAFSGGQTASTIFTDGTILELTNPKDFGIINDAYFVQGAVIGSTGTGVTDPFVRFAAQGNDTNQEGVNGDFRPVQFDENTDANFTDSLLLSDVPILTQVDLNSDGDFLDPGETGVAYFEFRLDMNQNNSDSFLIMDSLQIYLGNAPDLTGFNTPFELGTDGFGPNAKLVYAMDGWTGTGADKVAGPNDPSTFVVLNALEPGQGRSDYLLFIPVSMLDGIDTSVYDFIYFYTGMGFTTSYVLTKNADHDGDGDFKENFDGAKGDTVDTIANSNFEEWNILPRPSLEWEKREEGTGALQGGATFVVVGPSTTLTVVDNGANDIDSDAGQIKISGIPEGTYTVTETVAPSGFGFDDDVTRVVVVGGNQPIHAVIGTQGTDDLGNTDESDFHNPRGSLAWEKRTEAGALQGGATFVVVGAGTTITVVDNDTNGPDTDTDAGQIQLNNMLLGTYTVTETVAPSGYALDNDPTRIEDITTSDINAVIGATGDQTGDTDESDFHNRLGSLSWEKRTEAGVLQGGATFVVVGAGTTITVVDNDTNGPDTDTDAGQITLNNLLLGTYTVTETIAPSGYALDDDPTRIEDITSSDLNAVIGATGDQTGDTDESDFHNRLGSLSWEKRTEAGVLQGGATFVVVGAGTTITVVDNDTNGPDTDTDAGQITLNNLPIGSYTVTETIAPSGYALDNDPTRIEDITSSDLNAVIGATGDQTGDTDESDFHNRLGSLSWEKRTEAGVLQGGATFVVVGAGTTITVVDNDTNGPDTDTDAGQITLNNLLLGTYTVTETIAPSGYALDDDPTRIEDITSSDLNAVIGATGDQTGDTDESDFHNRLGSLSWEKRTEAGVLQGGATFVVVGAGTTITVVDNDTNGPDTDTDAGQITLNNLLLGTYTVTETIAPSGFGLDDDPTRIEDITSSDLNAVIGATGDQTGNTDESDFHNPLGSLSWEKRTEAGVLQGGATFVVVGAGTTITVVDNDTNGPDTDTDAGQITLNNIPIGTYTVTETIAPSGYALDDDPTRIEDITSSDLNAVIGATGDQTGDTDESDFHNRLGSLSWEKRTEAGVLQGGATFVVVGAGTTITVVDNDTNGPDTDTDAGQITLNNLLLGTYTVTETIAPSGYALDDDPTRIEDITSSDLNAVIGATGDQTGDTDESDFHNRLGSLSWEKRTEAGVLQGGATFVVVGAGTTITVVDNDTNGPDTDTDAGQITLNNLLLGTYTVTETIAPSGFGLDDDPTRIEDITSSDLNAVIGATGDQTGNTDESDFHNPLGSLSWEKRTEAGVLQGGATFVVVGAGTTITVVDNDTNGPDTDTDAGQITLNNLLLGTYTVTETIAPSGYALDDDPTRIEDITSSDLNAVIGATGDQTGDTDESDFHNRLGSLSWEKRTEAGVLQGGATFVVVGAGTTITVVDNDTNGPDTDTDAGQITLNNLLLGTYTVTETIAPSGYALDDDPTRIEDITSSDLNAVIGATGDQTGDTDESDFHNRLGSLSWEKRTEAGVLQGGATFVVVGAGTTITVVDNDTNGPDTDSDAGQITLNNLLLGTYTVTETIAPSGYALDDDPTRIEDITSSDLNAVIGATGDQTGDTDESDFHNRLGSLSWEKRTEAGVLQGGATFVVVGAGTTITVVDNDTNGPDTDTDAGQITLNNLLLGTYTVTETIAPSGYALDDDPTRIEDITSSDLNAVIGATGDQTGDTDESDFHNRLGSLSWEKRTEAGVLQGGATFVVVGAGTTITVVDNDTNGPDTDTDAGQITLNNLLLGTYTVTETIAPSGYALDDDPTRIEDITSSDLNAVIGATGDQTGDTDESDFHNRLGSLAWEKRDDGGQLLGGATFVVVGAGTTITVVDNDTNGPDTDSDAGQIKLNNLLLGTYTVTETIAPSGWQIENDPTRVEDITSSDLNAVIGATGDQTGSSDESDFHNFQLGSIHGFKFLDKDASGLINGTETGMEGVVIVLVGDTDGDGSPNTVTVTTSNGSTDANNDGVIDSLGTSDDGYFTFLDLHPGVYVITEKFTNGTDWGATVDHNDADLLGDNITTVTVGSGDELVAFNGLADLIPGQQEVLAGYQVIFGNVELGACGLSPGFWAQHLYLWDGDTTTNGRNGTTAFKLVADGKVVEPEMMDLFPAFDIDRDGTVEDALKTVIGSDEDVDGDGKADLVIQASDDANGDRYLVIEWDDAKEIINASITSPNKFADLTRMLINAYLNEVGVDGFNAPDGLMADAADWIIALGSNAVTGVEVNAAHAGFEYYVLKYNNAGPTEPTTPNGFSLTFNGSYPAWNNPSDGPDPGTTDIPAGSEIFNGLTGLICEDNPSSFADIQVSADQSIVVVGICKDGYFHVGDATVNDLGGYLDLV